MELKFMSEPPLDARLLSCPDCGEEEHIWIHSQQERRLRCGTCGRTFTESCGTPLYGLQYPRWLVLVVVSLLAHGGCPLGAVQAVVFAFKLDERTVLEWQARVGRHAKRVQAELVCQGNLEIGQVQGNELYVKTQQGPVWIATAMCVFSRLFIWGEVGAERKTALIERVVVRVRAAARRGTPILWVTDGFGAWVDAVRASFATRCTPASAADRVCNSGLTCRWSKSSSTKPDGASWRLNNASASAPGRQRKKSCAAPRPNWAPSTPPTLSA
jgi:transposase-like protein